jgi:hypothetical protein
MKTRIVVLSSTTVAVFLAVALLLRPSRTVRQTAEMAVAGRIPPAARAVIASKMRRHREQMAALIMNVVVLDYDGVGRTAGEMFDEPALARPIAGDELNGLLPEAFFQLQDGLRAHLRQVVVAAAEHDPARLANAFGEATRTCVTCHAAYLSGSAP